MAPSRAWARQQDTPGAAPAAGGSDWPVAANDAAPAPSSAARLAQELVRLGGALERRLAEADPQTAARFDGVAVELRRLERAVAARLAVPGADRADALAQLRQDLAWAVERLGARLAEAERRPGPMAAAAARPAVAAPPEPAPEAGPIVRAALLLASAAAALSVGAAGAALLKAPRRAADVWTPPSVIYLPLRPQLPLELPQPRETAGPRPAPPPVPSAAPAAKPAAPAGADYAKLAQAAADGDPAALAAVRDRAQSGDGLAQLLLAKLYDGGAPNLPPDLALARQWTERAAEGGQRAAMHNLAVYLMAGQGGPRDAPAAARWFRRAAELGVIDAQFNLGLLYEGGAGVPRNLVEAYRWFTIAANAGDGLARGKAVALEAKLTATERAEAQRVADAFEPGRPAAPVLAAGEVVAQASTVAETQRLLARLGYYVGETDGSETPAFHAAVAAYLHDHPEARAASAPQP